MYVDCAWEGETVLVKELEAAAAAVRVSDQHNAYVVLTTLQPPLLLMPTGWENLAFFCKRYVFQILVNLHGFYIIRSDRSSCSYGKPLLVRAIVWNDVEEVERIS